METSIMLAQIIGPIYLLAGFGMLFNKEVYSKLYQEFFKSPGLMYLGALFALIIGLMILQAHNTWDSNWTVVITLLGWLATLKGALLLVFPGKMTELAKAWKIEKRISIPIALAFVLGGVLSYFGFVA